MREIQIIGAREGNLKNISLSIPKNKLVVFTGLSGSGKSTLLIDVLFNECQRQYLEALAMQGIRKPKVERIRGLSPAVVLSQAQANKNPRSTVGTQTDLYTDLRMVYEKLGVRRCPFCGEAVSAGDCREETEKVGDDFYVYMYCRHCGNRMDKITRTHFSFNTKEGACPACEGLGRIHRPSKERAVNEALPLEEGAVRCWEKQYGRYQTALFHAACAHYGIPAPQGEPVARFTEIQKALLYQGVKSEAVKAAFPGRKAPKARGRGGLKGCCPCCCGGWRKKRGRPGRWRPFSTLWNAPSAGASGWPPKAGR